MQIWSKPYKAYFSGYNIPVFSTSKMEPHGGHPQKEKEFWSVFPPIFLKFRIALYSGRYSYIQRYEISSIIFETKVSLHNLTILFGSKLHRCGHFIQFPYQCITTGHLLLGCLNKVDLLGDRCPRELLISIILQTDLW